MSSLKRSEVPLVPLKDLGRWFGGGTPSKRVPAYWENGTIPWVSPKDMKVDYIKGAEDSITEKAVEESTTNLLPAGSVLVVTRSGILRHTFPVAVVDVPVTINQDLKALVPSEGIDPRYVVFALQAFNREILNECSKQGTTVNSIETKELLRFQIPLFAPEVQKHIVAEIEKQVSRLDKAVANLKRVKANLKRYKAAVLKAAVEGKLTEEWRKQNPDIEPADKLLERILEERRAKWEEAELAKMEAKGKVPKNDKWKGKYKEPVAPDTDGLPDLPAGWVWTTVEQLNFANRPCAYGVLQPGDDVEDGIPFVRVGDIGDGRVDLSGLKRISPEIAAQYPRTKLAGGELLITLVGAIGRTALVPETLKGANVARAVGVVPIAEAVDVHWIEIWFRNPAKVAEMTSKSHEVARKTLNLEDVRAASVAIPPLSEQHRIVAEVERHLSIIAEAETQVEANLQRAEQLRQSILKQAFTGKLVPQNPNDEPAGVLLEQIRATQNVQAKRQVARPRKHRPPAPHAGAPSPKPLPLVAEESATYGGSVVERILAVMEPGHEYSRADLVGSLGLTVGEWNTAIRELKQVEKVRQTGERRGARYALT
ncbi:restriction endonuclease subunit S [Geothermobacter hydrogeniphilus]|uniref:Type I restriction modification DNA specificity domain-containing protein n=1 Tax=Geothermobacter hydrogeniphilus TaxID=1969733 RepID=A0A1X0XLG9_9BACT|nr:restriction endonuclease subunit S [Geothermobacter hydrogeniphilus]ORJ53701.1 hypothetical protein B5V00_16220 [Geothermobacter hydrogeniphilus]